MKTRIIVGILLAAMLAAVLYFGGLILVCVLALFSFAATYELSIACKHKGYKLSVTPQYLFALGFPFVYYYLGLLTLVVFYMACLMATMIHSLFTKTHETQDVIFSLFLYIYPLIMLMCMELVYFTFGITAALMAFGAPEFCDAFAYFGGTLFGKHKLCPRISPKKTVEGSIASVLGGALFGVIVFSLQGYWTSAGTANLLMLASIGLCCGVFSQFGDLFASTIKRWADIKDFSSVFPGHGGIMDRIDSILFCTPFVLVAFNVLTKVGAYS